ncbi:50S ribosomal protein L37ae [Candidatus Bathyarchaeota archaeon]|nr:50S ribosomal protein L37ae [Candidatus Bathyarchaeota archaeon]
MGRSKKVGTTGRFGSRYGTLVRYRVKTIESYKNAQVRCLKCKTRAIKRESVGLWTCKKCGVRFTGGAYNITTPQGLVSARVAKRKSKEKEK